MVEKVECVVIGAGVVGLAIGQALALKGKEVIVLEAADIIGSGISSRNSEVVHAGIYYTPGSLKATLCVAGRKALETYAPEHGVPVNQCGKLIVANGADEVARLGELLKLGHTNGVDDLRLIPAEEARAMEPEIQCDGALYSPSTAIVDSHALMLAMQGDMEAEGGMVAFNSPVIGGAAGPDGIVIETGGADAMTLACAHLINAAGLGAPDIARKIKGGGDAPDLKYAKGCYFELSGKAPFSHLIYPAPHTWGLGVHLTLDMAGRAKFGPDVEWIDAPDYDVDPARGDQFYEAVRRYWPGLPDDSLISGYAGIRPKLVGPGEAPADFRIDTQAQHGVKGMIHLFGIESPGLTSALAFGDLISGMVE